MLFSLALVWEKIFWKILVSLPLLSQRRLVMSSQKWCVLMRSMVVMIRRRLLAERLNQRRHWLLILSSERLLPIFSSRAVRNQRCRQRHRLRLRILLQGKFKSCHVQRCNCFEPLPSQGALLEKSNLLTCHASESWHPEWLWLRYWMPAKSMLAWQLKGSVGKIKAAYLSCQRKLASRAA